MSKQAKKIELIPCEGGLRVIREARYGHILLALRERGFYKSSNKVLGYLLTGVENKTGHFPGNPEWNHILRKYGAEFIVPKKAWFVPVSAESNEMLVPVLEASMSRYEEQKKVARREYYAKYAPPHARRNGGGSSDGGL